MKGSDIRAFVARVVAEELRRQLPLVLSEMYVKRIVSEAPKQMPGEQPRIPGSRTAPVQQKRGRIPTNLRELMAGDPEEEVFPSQPIVQDHEGIYQNKRTQDEKRPPAYEARQRLIASMPGVFEGVEPLGDPGSPDTTVPAETLGETQQQFGEEGVPLSMLEGIGVSFGHARETAQASSSRHLPGGTVQVDEAALKQLERRRAALDAKPAGSKRAG